MDTKPVDGTSQSLIDVMQNIPTATKESGRYIVLDKNEFKLSSKTNKRISLKDLTNRVKDIVNDTKDENKLITIQTGLKAIQERERENSEE